MESFAGQTGPMVVVTRCEEDGNRKFVCAFRLADIDGDMDAYFTGCVTGVHSESDLLWDVPRLCSEFTVKLLKTAEICTFYLNREQLFVILEVSMWKRLLN